MPEQPTRVRDAFFERALAAADAAAAPSGVWEALAPFFKGLGAWGLACGAHDRRRRLLAHRSDYEPEFQRDVMRLDLPRDDFVLDHVDASHALLVRGVPAEEAAAHDPAERMLAKHGVRCALVVRLRQDWSSTLGLLMFSRRDDPARAVAGGVAARFRMLAGILAARYDPRDDPDAALSRQPARLRPLSRREADALGLLATGERLEGIAHAMGITEATARKHVASARRKLGARTRDQAVAVAVRLGLIAH